MPADALDRLQQTDAEHPQRLTDLERAVVAFSRWQGRFQDNELRRKVAKALLDELILRMEPDDWQALKDFEPIIGEQQTRELMHYALQLSLADLKDKRAEIERMPDWSLPDDRPAPEHPSPVMRRRRDRED